MAALMEVLNERDFSTYGVADTDTVLRNHIPVVESVRHKNCTLDSSSELQQITLCPEGIVIARKTVLILCKKTIAVQLVVLRAVCGISTVDEVVEGVDVFSQPPSRMTN